jgi:XTP/dITP diphosphohydrolase
MSRLIIATNNAGKVKEIKAIFEGVYDEVLSLKEAGIALEVEEDGVTFEQNAVKKAVEAAQASGCDALADDSGLCVDALGGAPGVFSARYAGPQPPTRSTTRSCSRRSET